MAMNHSRRKRRRDDDDTGHRVKKRISKVCSVSIFSEGGTTESYNDVVERLRKLGARHSSSVHRKVDILVASKEAAVQRTQRVRKALKYNVPIVSLKFLDACEAEQSFVDPKPFALDVPAEKVTYSKVTCTPVKDYNSIVRVLDLGCCCACHDEGKLKCEWCEQYH